MPPAPASSYRVNRVWVNTKVASEPGTDCASRKLRFDDRHLRLAENAVVVKVANRSILASLRHHVGDVRGLVAQEKVSRIDAARPVTCMKDVVTVQQ